MKDEKKYDKSKGGSKGDRIKSCKSKIINYVIYYNK